MKSQLVSYCLPKKTVSNVLSDFMPSGIIEPFNFWLSAYDAVISGSATTFMVAQAQEVPANTEPRYLESHTAPPQWTPADLDIWILPKDEKHCDRFLEWFAIFQFEHLDTKLEGYEGFGKNEFTVETFKYRGIYKKIQIMVLTTIEPRLYIMGYFDLTVVHNYWDGTQLYSAWTKLTCNNRMMQCNIDTEDPNPRRKERIFKYHFRGFELGELILQDKEQWEGNEIFKRVRLLSKEQIQQSQQDEQEKVCSQLAVFDISDEVVMG